MARNKNISRTPSVAGADELNEKLDRQLEATGETVHKEDEKVNDVVETENLTDPEELPVDAIPVSTGETTPVSDVEETPFEGDAQENPQIKVDEPSQEQPQEAQVQEPDAPKLPEVEETIHIPEEEAKANQAEALKEEMEDKRVLDALDPLSRMSLGSIIEYITDMQDVSNNFVLYAEYGDLVVNIGPRKQAALYNNIMDILTKTPNENFALAMNYLCHLFTLNKDSALSVIHLMRFQENIPLDTIGLKVYPRLMTMLCTLADPTTRKRDLKNVNMEYALEYGFSDAAKARIVNFFQS